MCNILHRRYLPLIKTVYNASHLDITKNSTHSSSARLITVLRQSSSLVFKCCMRMFGEKQNHICHCQSLETEYIAGSRFFGNGPSTEHIRG